jgi:hypothetical protein
MSFGCKYHEERLVLGLCDALTKIGHVKCERACHLVAIGATFLLDTLTIAWLEHNFDAQTNLARDEELHHLRVEEIDADDAHSS